MIQTLLKKGVNRAGLNNGPDHRISRLYISSFDHGSHGDARTLWLGRCAPGGACILFGWVLNLGFAVLGETYSFCMGFQMKIWILRC